MHNDKVFNEIVNKYNVSFELTQLFNDFSQSLFIIIFKTYLGDDISSPEDKLNHFNWSWNKNLDNFKEEGIIFHDTDLAYDYFLEFAVTFFYLIDKEDSLAEIELSIRLILAKLFTFNEGKTNREIENFLKLYKILEKTVKYTI